MSYWATWDEVWDQISTFLPTALTEYLTQYDLGINDVSMYGFSEDGFWGLAWAVINLKNMLYDMLGFYDETNILGFDMYAAIFYAKSGGVTLKNMNDAMSQGEYTDIKDFLTLNWVFQQIMFDQPFDPERYLTLLNTVRT